MDHFKCGGYVFNSNFDSGNLAKVELIRLNEDIVSGENIINTEFNIWTKPDCGGTEYENLNRSWFLFSICGGEPYQICKINVVNLNKQAKLFSQGMHPVIRIGETGKWERIKDSPTYFIDIDNFTLSFIHKPGQNVHIKYYYAFTFPFTYTECQEQLHTFDKLYLKNVNEINYICKRLMLMSGEKIDEDGMNNYDADQSFYDINMRTTIALRELARMTNKDLESEIYYHRELLINSVEGRKIDLLTITSFNGIRNVREQRLHNLFPDTKTLRCNTFKNKKIIFISSRVHPGETPASFVLNGFLKLIFDKRSTVAATLRNMYVFKIVPFLNPDGVFNGCYRSDTLGHNLNRMYLSPKIETQPTIYAVRKLIRYYHYDKDMQENEDNIQPPDNQITNKIENIYENNNFDENISIKDIDVDSQGNKSQNSLQYSKEDPDLEQENSTASSRSQSSESEIELIENKSTSSSSGIETMKEMSPTPSLPPAPPPVPSSVQPARTTAEERSTGKVFLDKLMTEIKPIHIPGPTPVYPKKPLGLKKHDESNTKLPSSSSRFGGDTTAICGLLKKKAPLIYIKQGGAATNKTISPLAPPLPPRKELYCRSRTPTQLGQHRITKRRNDGNATGAINNNNLNISSDFIQAKIDEEQVLEQTAAIDSSNMFLYIDLHGHASKKGIFMYGNHLPNVAEAVECMLLPRLMSMNCHHFHFDACVFSERNMYHKGKRDGLSKEGSGRVAVYKTIGLIKSYTLESNYNTGKYVNVLPPRGKDGTCRKANMIAPKYTPAIFEDVGRALGPSILDLTSSNPFSRIHNSEFKTLQGLRNSLRTEIDKTFASRTVFNAKALTTKAKRLKNASMCCSSLARPETSSKENKGKNALNKQVTTFSKKETPSGRKKGKILCDVLASSSSSSKFQEQQPVPPSKRPKVVKKIVIPLDGSDSDAAGGPSTSSTLVTGKKSQDLLQVEISANIQIGVASSSTSIDSTAVYFSANSTESLLEPCCSHSVCGPIQIGASTGASSSSASFPMKSKKLPNFQSPTVSLATTITTAGGIQSSSAQPSSSQSLLTSLHGKKSKSNLLKIRSKYGANASGATSGLLKQLKRSNNSSKDSLRLKKKKIIKSDTNLKRKKSRVF